MNIFSLELPYVSLRNEAIRELRETYLRDSRVWYIMSSQGKDSTTVVDLVWNMLLELPPELRTKTIHIVSSSTRVEAPVYQKHLFDSVALMRQAAREQGLPIEVHLAEPEMKNRFYVQVIGRGNPAPNERSSYRWCSDKLKIKPTGEIVIRHMAERLELDEYDCLIILGVRSEESTRRKASMEKHAINDSRFARHADLPRALVMHPIADWTKDDVWDYLTSSRERLAWGGDPHQLRSMYSNASEGECQLTAPEGKQFASCGGSRFGCYVCCFNGRTDPMLASLYNTGDENILPLYHWKLALYDMRNDARFRLPLRRRGKDQVDKAADIQLFDFGAPITWAYQPGPLSILARKLLLEGLLEAQMRSGYLLIEEDEIEAIMACWRDEQVYIKREEILARPIPVKDHLALKPDGSVNTKESTFQGAISERIREVTPEELSLLSERANVRFDGIIWIPCVDRTKVKEVTLPPTVLSIYD